jgi:hypothetical protein
MAVAAALPPGPGFGESTAELGAGAIAPPPDPHALADQQAVVGIGTAGGHDRPIALLLLPVGAGAGLVGAGGRHHRGGGSVAPEGYVTLGNTWGRGRGLAGARLPAPHPTSRLLAASAFSRAASWSR